MRAGWILRKMQYEGLHKHIWNLSEGRIFKFWRILCTKGFKGNLKDFRNLEDFAKGLKENLKDFRNLEDFTKGLKTFEIWRILQRDLKEI